MTLQRTLAALSILAVMTLAPAPASAAPPAGGGQSVGQAKARGRGRPGRVSWLRVRVRVRQFFQGPLKKRMAKKRERALEKAKANKTAPKKDAATETKRDSTLGGIGATLDPRKVQQTVATMPDPNRSTGSIDVKPTGRMGGYHGTNNIAWVNVRSIFNKGLPGGGAGLDLVKHAEPTPGVGPKSAFRGTTPTISVGNGTGAAYWAGEGGVVVEIRKIPTWDLSHVLDGRIRTPTGFRGLAMKAETEYAVPRLVYPWQIKRAGLVAETGTGRPFVKTWVDNPHYGKPQHFLTAKNANIREAAAAAVKAAQATSAK